MRVLSSQMHVMLTDKMTSSLTNKLVKLMATEGHAWRNTRQKQMQKPTLHYMVPVFLFIKTTAGPRKVACALVFLRFGQRAI